MSVTEQNNVPSDSDLIYSYRYGKWGGRWTWTLFDCNGAVVKQCEWWGFDTMNDALNNLAEHIEKLTERGTLQELAQGCLHTS